MGEIFENFTIAFAESGGIYFTAIARWVFIFLALFILLRSIFSLLRTKNPSEVWAYWHFQTGGGLPDASQSSMSIPVTHWENVSGRAKSCDLELDDAGISRNHATLSRGHDGIWSVMDLGSSNGTFVNGHQIRPWRIFEVEPGDEIQLGRTRCELFPVSLEEHRNNM